MMRSDAALYRGLILVALFALLVLALPSAARAAGPTRGAVHGRCCSSTPQSADAGTGAALDGAPGSSEAGRAEAFAGDCRHCAASEGEDDKPCPMSHGSSCDDCRTCSRSCCAQGVPVIAGAVAVTLADPIWQPIMKELRAACEGARTDVFHPPLAVA